MATNTPSITAEPGRLFLLKISDGSSPTTYQTVAGLRANDITINGNPVDISNKGSNGWQEMLPNAGIKSVDITGSGVFDAGAAAPLRTIMISALNGGTFIEAEVISGFGDKFTGTWSCQTFKRSGNHNDAELFDVTMKSSGPVIYSQA
jgi:TP901-1 family phage major tail protein